MKSRLLITATILAALLLSCSEQPPAPAPLSTDPPLTVADLTPIDKAVAASNNRFGIELIRQVAEDTDDTANMFISPISVSMALGMTMNGAVGETRRQMEDVLELSGLTPTEINRSYLTLRRLLIHLDDDVTLTIANSIWARLGLPLVDEFVATNDTFYEAVVRSLDFDRDDAADTINAWVYDNTGGRIDKIIDAPIDGIILMYLMNAIYFKASWTVPFNPDSTVEEQFYITEDDSTACMMMKKNGVFHFRQNQNFKAIELPYGDSSYAMLAILPLEGVSTDSVLRLFTPENWNNWTDWTNDIWLKEVPVALPRFRIEYELSLKDVLMSMGMEIPFDGSADFSGMVEGGGIFISDVKHKTFVEVNEEGTEAAAVTNIGMVTSLPPTFVADRPFLFFIYERATRTIVFAGQLANPSTQ